MIARVFVASLIAGATAIYSAQATALDAGVLSGLEARGLVDLDSSASTPPLSNEVDAVTTTPFTRSVVSVADALPGTFEYASSADIGSLAIKVFGTLTNGSTSGIGNFEVPIMRVSGEIRDVITLESTLTTPYDVTLQLRINGTIGVTGGSAVASASGLLEFGTNPGVNGFDGGNYPIGPVDDILSVTRTVSGSSVEMDLKAFLGFNVFQVDPGATVTGDLGSTAFLTLLLPPTGVALASSESGTFGVPIPEPQTYALMLAGLVLVGAALRRRTHA